jgi:short-subunit dehydrogenase
MSPTMHPSPPPSIRFDARSVESTCSSTTPATAVRSAGGRTRIPRAYARCSTFTYSVPSACRAVLPAMLEQRAGVIVNFASTIAWVPMPGGATAYSAAKAAVVAMSESLRAELRESGIDVRIFSPPHTSTDAGRRWPLDLPKIFTPEWVADQFVRTLRRDAARATPGGNGALLFIQRVAPALATRIMNGVGFRALAKLR